eukprot:90209-Pyramimonas_sp.AAC.1
MKRSYGFLTRGEAIGYAGRAHQYFAIFCDWIWRSGATLFERSSGRPWCGRWGISSMVFPGRVAL